MIATLAKKQKIRKETLIATALKLWYYCKQWIQSCKGYVHYSLIHYLDSQPYHAALQSRKHVRKVKWSLQYECTKGCPCPWIYITTLGAAAKNLEGATTIITNWPDKSSKTVITTTNPIQ
jgi:hypothetical protein